MSRQRVLENPRLVFWSHAVNACGRPCGAPRVPPAAAVRFALLLLYVDRTLPSALVFPDSALRQVRLPRASADFSAAVPPGSRGESSVAGPPQRSLQVRPVLFWQTRRIILHSVRTTIGHPRPWPGDLRCKGLKSACCTSSPRFRHRLFRSRLATDPCQDRWFRSSRSMRDFHP